MRPDKACVRCKRVLPSLAFDLNMDCTKKKQCRKCCEEVQRIALNRPVRVMTKRAAKKKRLSRNHLCQPKSAYAKRDSRLWSMGFKSYSQYLYSPLWKEIRDNVLHKANRRCEACGGQANQVHHTRYKIEDLKGKTLEHLHAICETCHAGIEFDSQGRKRTMEETVAWFHRIKHLKRT